MSFSFIESISEICDGNHKLESAVIAGYRTIMEAEDGREAIFEEDTAEPGNDTITMDLDAMANNADQIQAVLQKKKDAMANSKSADEQLIALGNGTTDSTPATV